MASVKRDDPPNSEKPERDEEDFKLPTKKTPEAATPQRAQNRRRMALIVVAPIVSVATLMLGLRVGAGSAVHAATIFAAPPAKPASPGAPVPIAWQVLTYLEDRGVRETVGMRDITVTVKQANGHEASWSGSSNVDGIAEATLTLPDLKAGDPVTVEVTQKGESQPLALGVVSWPSSSSTWARDKDDHGERAAARPSKREGALGLDVVVEGERLVVGFETTIWTHVTMPNSAMDSSHVTLTVTPEPGLSASAASKIGCDGWSETQAIAMAHVVGVQIDAKDPEGRSGTWFGPLPVAPGAFFVGMPRYVPEGKAETAVLVAPNPRNVVYAEVDDEQGRAFAAALPVGVEQGDPTPRAHFEIPPLAPGLHWLVVSGEPRGAEKLAGAAVAKPFMVGTPGDAVKVGEACSLGPWLARRPAAGFPRWLAVDGMATRGASNRARHRAGLFIGLFSLFAAALLEMLLLTAASREARAVMLLAELDEPEAERAKVTAKSPGGGLVIALLVALLGFALLAAMLIAKG